MRISILLATLLTFSVISCGEESRAESEVATSGSTSSNVPELKPRTPGLLGPDLQKVQERYRTAREALLRDPRDVDALVSLAGIFAYEARVTGDHPYYYPAALSLVDRAIKVDPQHFEAVFTKASILLSLHRFDSALEVARHARALAPDAAAPYGALTDAFVELGMIDSAVKAADRMVAIRPDLMSYARISYLRELHGDIDGAIDAMARAVRAGAPGSEQRAWARTTLGDLYLSSGLVDSAEREYLMASRERDQYPFALAGLARIAYAKGNSDRALQFLDKAIEIMPEFSFVSYQAAIHRLEGRVARADSLVEAVDEMLAEDEASGHMMNLEYSGLYADHGVNLDEAVKRAREEVQKRPKNAAALRTLAFALYRQGDFESASTVLARAASAEPSSSVVKIYSGLIDIAQNRVDQGERKIREARVSSYEIPILLGAHIKEVLAQN